MALAQVYKYLKHIESLPGANDKIRVAKGYLRDPDFLKVCNYALSSKYVFHVQKFPEYKPRGVTTTALTIFDFLEKMNAMEGASNETKEFLFSLASTDPETYEVVRRICEGDLKCGLSTKGINKAVPGTIFYIPYMRCSGEEFIGRISYPAFAQEKNDGSFANMFCHENGGIEFLTRNGKNIRQLRALKRALRGFLKKGYVYTGELLVMKNGVLLDRSTGNGIITSCIYGTANQEDADCVVIRVWDCLPIKDFWNGHCKTPYKERFSHVTKIANAIKSPEFDTVLTQIVNSEKEARKFYARIRAAGGEGEVLKDMNFEWKDHTSTHQVKIINVSEIELRIVSWNYGAPRSKYEHLCGAVVCESECGRIKVKISGLTDEQRAFDWDKHEGDVLKAKFKELSYGKGNNYMSLVHPRIDELRPDRRTAQTLDDLIAREGWEKDPAYLKYLKVCSR